MDQNPAAAEDGKTIIAWKKKAEVALHYRCDIRTITNLMSHGVLPFVKIGRFVRFDLVACDEAIRKYQRGGMAD